VHVTNTTLSFRIKRAREAVFSMQGIDIEMVLKLGGRGGTLKKFSPAALKYIKKRA
jgi:hypothetical protein